MNGKSITVKQAADIMGKNPQFIRLGLQSGRVPIGASKTAIDKANKLDVIEADPKLREIYASIIKEYTIKFVA